MDAGRSNYGRGRRLEPRNNQNQGGRRPGPSLHRGSPRQPQGVSWNQVRGNHPPPQQLSNYRPLQTSPPQQLHQFAGRGVWTGRPRGSSPPSPSPVRPLSPPQQSAAIIHFPSTLFFFMTSLFTFSPSLFFFSADELGVQKLKISEQEALPSSSKRKEKQIQAMRRPDNGGSISIKSIRLLVNHFPVEFDPEKTFNHYHVDVKLAAGNTVRKSNMRLIREKLFSRDPRFQNIEAAYDGANNIFSSVHLPEGEVRVEISGGEEIKSGSYTVTIKLVKVLELSDLNGYMRGLLPDIPREPLPVLEFLEAHLGAKYREVNDVKTLRQLVNDALTGLKVTLTHRRTRQKYTIAKLTEEDVRDSSFESHDGKEIRLVKYFKEKWGKDIMYQDIPCLELGTVSKSNKVPLEFCLLVEGQRYPKEQLPVGVAGESSRLVSSASRLDFELDSSWVFVVHQLASW
ncbi:UNVERIFIED_CONTAM: Protein argonaute 2 [Sesamum indicum]